MIGRSGKRSAPRQSSGAAADEFRVSDWSPTFPAGEAAAKAAVGPAAWVAPLLCNGEDTHLLSVPLVQASMSGCVGLLLGAVDLRFHFGSTLLVVALVLLVIPLRATFFSIRVKGPTLIIRRWGVRRVVPLSRVGSVDAVLGRSGTALELHTDTPGSPYRVVLSSRGHTVPQPARDHLLGWLDRPDVVLAPDAANLLRGANTGASGKLSPRQRTWLVASSTFLAAVIALSSAFTARPPSGLSSQFEVGGAPGYFVALTTSGQRVALGLPWGEPCYPIDFIFDSKVPAPIYVQLQTVIDQANRAGLPVSLAPAGTLVAVPSSSSSSESETIGVFISATTTAAPVVDGAPQLISTTSVLTPGFGALYYGYIQATVHVHGVRSDRQLRTAIRQLVALAEGVGGTTVTESGLPTASSTDAFSASDVHAMDVTSGCQRT